MLINSERTAQPVYSLTMRHATLQGTPAMAAGLREHVWLVDGLIRFRCKRE